jgi:hypothetical protein
MATKTYHPELAAGRWFTFSLAEQLGNVGSEYERALHWKEQRDAERFEHAFARMLELLDLTIADSRWEQNCLRELNAVREQACRELSSDECSDGATLREYFYALALKAREAR